MTEMTVVNEKPPHWDLLQKHGYTDLAKCIFTWGDIIYNPDGVPIDSALIAHESVHRRQQEGMGGPEGWWKKWLNEPAFRAEQEAQGYGAQYKHLCGLRKDRNDRDRYLRAIARHFASGTYKLTLSQADARAAILKRAG